MTTLADKRILRLPEVVSFTGLSRATIYRMIGRGEFPRQVQISPRLTGWRAEDVEAWLTSRRCVGSVHGSTWAG